jgi:Holliday junction resolvase RusA-like endonuclease
MIPRSKTPRKSLTPRILVLGIRPRAAKAAVTLPIPPSLNAMFYNTPPRTLDEVRVIARGRGKTLAYRNWLKEALQEIQAQRVPLVPGDIGIKVVIARPSARNDLDNFIKPILDALVKGYVIEDDNKVREVHFMWGDAQGCAVTISQKE